MNKSEFLHILRSCLGQLTAEEREQNIAYYEELFSDMLEEGMSEEEAAAHLGDPEQIAREILAEQPLPLLVKSRVRPSGGWTALSITLIVLGSPVWLPLLMAAELKTPSLLMVDVELGQAFCGVGIHQFTGCLVAPTRSGGIPDCTEVGRLLTAKQRDLVRNRNRLRSAVCPAFRREVRMKPVSDIMLTVTGQVSDFVYDPRFETKAVGLNRSTFPAALMLTGMMSSPTRGRKARRVRDIAEHAVIRALREMRDYADDMDSRYAVTGYAHR